MNKIEKELRKLSVIIVLVAMGLILALLAIIFLAL
jgi:hypothetical protein